MKITVIGGSFCPPTLAHLALAKAAGAAIGADLSLLVPVPVGYLKGKKVEFPYERLSNEMRLQMLRAMVADEPNLGVDDSDILADKPSRTHEMLQTLQAKYPGADIYFVIGSDKLRQMNRWGTAAALLSQFRILVTSREGEDIEQLLDTCENLSPLRERFCPFVLSDEWTDVSSTKVRELMRSGDEQKAAAYVHPEVLRLLKQAYMNRELHDEIDVSDGISRFRDEHDFLSNFHAASVEYEGIVYTNNEAAFQAQKVLEHEAKLPFAALPPGKAKRMGRHVPLRADWESVKEALMYEIVLAKFSQNPQLREKLLATGDVPLYEGNTWNDFYWGVCRGKGKNALGKILMRVRQELR